MIKKCIQLTINRYLITRQLYSSTAIYQQHQQQSSVLYDWSSNNNILNEQLTTALKQLQWHKPTPIQYSVLDIIQQHNNNNNNNNNVTKSLWLHAPTGTGKTLAFLLLVLNRNINSIINNIDYVDTIIIADTEILQQQICRVLNNIQQALKLDKPLYTLINSNNSSNNAVLNTPIIVSNPHNMLQYIHNNNKFDLSNLHTLVLDEADQQLIPKQQYSDYSDELATYSDLSTASKLLNQLLIITNHKLQLIAATATISDPAIHRLQQLHNIDMTIVSVAEQIKLSKHHNDRQQLQSPKTLKHYYYITDTHNINNNNTNDIWSGNDLLLSINAVSNIVNKLSNNNIILLLCLDSQLHTAHKLLTQTNVQHYVLSDTDFDPLTLNNNKNSNNNQQASLIVSTLGQMRGIDLPLLTHVLLSVPLSLLTSHTYMHASGRVGRAEQQGTSILLIKQTDVQQLKRLANKCNIEVSSYTE